ncbi:MAG TPA: 50S ribosomal protein L11 methyltransferase [Candidatus Limnocylindrales bacterium]
MTPRRHLAAARGFVTRHAPLRPVPGLEPVQLHLTDDVLGLWRATQLELGEPDAPLPFWAFAWAGGMALSRYLRDQPDIVRGRRILDFASGSGLCGIEAMRLGAAEVTAVDIDPFSIAAIGLNARANGVRVTARQRDLLDGDPPQDVDVLLAADCWYEATLARRVLPWLQRCAAVGIEVVVGDPARHYLPTAALEEVARYDVRTTTELEDLDQKVGYVYRLSAASR